MSSSPNPFDRRISAVLLTLSLGITWHYYQTIHIAFLPERLEGHTQILQGVAVSPYQYRVLIPLMAEAMARLFGGFAGYGAGLMIAYLLIDMMAFGLLLPLIFRFLRTWFSREQALIGTLVIAALIPLQLRDHIFQPWSSVENLLVVAALLLMIARSHIALGVVIVLAALNRETSICLVAAYAATAIPWRAVLKREKIDAAPFRWTALYAVLWLAVTAGLRAVLGEAPPLNMIQEYWEYNSQPVHYVAAIIMISLFLGAFWGFAVRGFSRAPVFLQGAAIIVPMYLLGLLVLSRWYETRPLIPIYPVCVALGLAYIFPGATPSRLTESPPDQAPAAG